MQTERPKSLRSWARLVAVKLADRREKIVLAESCTAGLVAASLGAVPGISEWLCGSAVVYRIDTKQQWLRISGALIEAHTAVSRPVAEAMAKQVLQVTPEADWGASITGHLGPHAPAAQDGVVFVAVARRRPRSVRVVRYRLDAKTRAARQREAAVIVLQEVCRALEI